MKVRVRLGITALTLVLAGVLAGGSSARPYLSPGELAGLTSQPATVAGNTGQTSGDGQTDAGASAKKGKGWCVGDDSDADPVSCPSHKKAAKKGKGYRIG